MSTLIPAGGVGRIPSLGAGGSPVAELDCGAISSHGGWGESQIDEA